MEVVDHSHLSQDTEKHHAVVNIVISLLAGKYWLLKACAPNYIPPAFQ
jgi:hypothetical protein